MLADQVLAEGREEFEYAWGPQMWGEFDRTLRGAQKFVLDRSLGEVLGEMPRDQVRQALPFCRLPFPVIWIEIAQNDREAFTRKGVAPGLFQPVRVGLLCEQADDDPNEFYCSLAWSFSVADAMRMENGGTVNISAGALYVNTQQACTYPAQDGLSEVTERFTAHPIVSRYFNILIHKLEKAKRGDLIEPLSKAAQIDWEGEIWFWLAALAMLNARNGARSIPRPIAPALAKARAKARKPALMDFHELTLRLSPGEAQRERGANVNGRQATHAHVVRGHFKVRSTGVYWWRPHIRGDVAEGFADKRYKVKA